jgi:hypothetical protein
MARRGVGISLNAEEILDYSAIKAQLDRKAYLRFKSLTEKAAIPLHVGDQEGMTISIHPTYGSPGDPPKNLRLRPEIAQRAGAIAEHENRKLAEAGVEGPWIDGEKLAVQGINLVDNYMMMGVSIIKWSQILALKDFSFRAVADLLAFKLDTNTHVTAVEDGRRVLLVGQRGRKPGEPRMGSEALLAPVGENVQWTLATNGTIDYDVMNAAMDGTGIWKLNSMREFREELGVEGSYRLRYLGTIVDPVMFVGALGIVGVIETSLSPYDIDDAKKRARHGIEVPVLDFIPLEQDEVAKYLRANRSNMVPQLVTGIALLGYQNWGLDFLKKADR